MKGGIYMIFGIILIFVSAFLARSWGIVGVLICTFVASFMFNAPFAFMIFGVSIANALGKSSVTNMADAPEITRMCGDFIDLIGFICFIGGLIGLIAKYAF